MFTIFKKNLYLFSHKNENIFITLHRKTPVLTGTGVHSSKSFTQITGRYPYRSMIFSSSIRAKIIRTDASVTLPVPPVT